MVKLKEKKKEKKKQQQQEQQQQQQKHLTSIQAVIASHPDPADSPELLLL